MKEIMTVSGPVEAEKCGMVLSHEHLFIDLRNQASALAGERKICKADHNRLMADPYCLKDNLLLDDFESAAGEAASLLEYGCNTVVDCTVDDIGRDPVRLRSLSAKTGLNIVAGCGWYTGDTHSDEFRKRTADELAEELISEIRHGAGESGIRPGIIGEIGTSKRITDGEWKALTAAALAQRETGLALQIHIYPWSDNGRPAVKELFRLGVAPERIVICHSDVQPDRDYIFDLLRSGVYVELDNFGKEFTPADDGFADGIFISDRERAVLAADIISRGFGKQLLLTNDICLKCMLTEYGGQGYSHIFRGIIPMIAEQGIPEKYLRETILHDNPLRMLTGNQALTDIHMNTGNDNYNSIGKEELK